MSDHYPKMCQACSFPEVHPIRPRNYTNIENLEVCNRCGTFKGRKKDNSLFIFLRREGSTE